MLRKNFRDIHVNLLHEVVFVQVSVQGPAGTINLGSEICIGSARPSETPARSHGFESSSFVAIVNLKYRHQLRVTPVLPHRDVAPITV